jgi:FMN phosphatase YigB (HAD superfamily)
LAKKLSAETLIEETKKYIALYAEVPAVLETLYGARCYKLIVTSNAHRVFLRAMLSSISYYFAETISAPEDFGMVKCSEKFYGALLAHLGVRAEELVHVGDHRLHDCLIPRRLGILAYHLDRSLSKDDAREQFSIQSLRALLTHLRE